MILENEFIVFPIKSCFEHELWHSLGSRVV